MKQWCQDQSMQQSKGAAVCLLRHHADQVQSSKRSGCLPTLWMPTNAQHPVTSRTQGDAPIDADDQVHTSHSTVSVCRPSNSLQSSNSHFTTAQSSVGSASPEVILTSGAPGRNCCRSAFTTALQLAAKRSPYTGPRLTHSSDSVAASTSHACGVIRSGLVAEAWLASHRLSTRQDASSTQCGGGSRMASLHHDDRSARPSG